MCYESNVALPREMSETENELIESTKVAEEVLEQFEVNVQLEANIAVPQLKMFSLPQAFSRIRANFSWLRATIDTLFFILKILKLIYLGRVVIIIYFWIRNYLKDVAHENNMVGDQFFLIDQRRKMSNKQCFDVLRKFELRKVHTSGGFVAQIFRGVLKDFNRSADVNQSLSNDHCRREPTEVNWSFIEGGVSWIWFVFSLLFLQKIFTAYATRLRLLVASTTFPQRDYVRNLWLYNNMLEVRLKKFYVAKESMESWVENPYLIPVESAFDIMYRKYSKMKFILRFFAKQACFICGDRSSGEDPRRYCRYHKTYFCQNCLYGYPCFGMCYACRAMPWFQEFDFDKKSDIDYDLATRAGYIVCRRATNSAWQYFLFQQSPKFTDWAPPFGLCRRNEKLSETADRILERDLELESDEYENVVDFEALVDILDGKGRKTGQMVYYFAAILDDDSAEKDFSLPEAFVDFDWVDIERACKLVGKQNLQPALLKLDYFLRKYMSK
uniref:Nudix hydrolase domain-containing protein n=1 Tax=Romanomermis culicivorax TaxID=13658 RepID=A0A915JKC1_ROMCU